MLDWILEQALEWRNGSRNSVLLPFVFIIGFLQTLVGQHISMQDLLLEKAHFGPCAGVPLHPAEGGEV